MPASVPKSVPERRTVCLARQVPVPAWVHRVQLRARPRRMRGPQPITMRPAQVAFLHLTKQNFRLFYRPFTFDQNCSLHWLLTVAFILQI